MRKCIEEVGARAVRDFKTDGTKAISRVGCSYRGLTREVLLDRQT